MHRTRMLYLLTSLIFFSSMSSRVACANTTGERLKDESWIRIWASASQPNTNPETLSNQTLRQLVHINWNPTGSFRIRLSNTYGRSTLSIQTAHIAFRDQGFRAQAGSDQAITFAKQTSVAIPAGGDVFSDSILIRDASVQDFLISFYFEGPVSLSTFHALSKDAAAISTLGNFAASEDLPVQSIRTSGYLLSGLDVLRDHRKLRSVVAFGDSITDGAGTQIDHNDDYPETLERLRRLGKNHRDDDVFFINEGICANRVLKPQTLPGDSSDSGLSRFKRDALDQPGATGILFLEGINDISFEPVLTPPGEIAAKLIAGYKKLASSAHGKGLKFFMGTLTPIGRAAIDSPSRRKARELVNSWIRQNKMIDGFADFDLAVRDPLNVEQMKAEFDSGDHLHPNPQGYAAMAAQGDLDF